MKKALLLLLIVFTSLTQIAYATDWTDIGRRCPMCGHNNKFLTWASYGNYIYSEPSKYQYVYWPYTDKPSVYSCVDCHYSALIGEFDSVKSAEIAGVRSYLETIKNDKKYSDYSDIPILTRLDYAEKINGFRYHDNESWCRFYRILGYHTERAGKIEEAKIARGRAIKLAQRSLKDTTSKGREKEFYYIIGAMYHFTNNDDSALVYLEKATTLRYESASMKKEDLDDFNDYLDALSKDYMDRIRKKLPLK